MYDVADDGAMESALTLDNHNEQPDRKPNARMTRDGEWRMQQVERPKHGLIGGKAFDGVPHICKKIGQGQNRRKDQHRH